jgi:hypothetical protein
MNIASPASANPAQESKQLLMKEIQAKWSKFSEPEIAALTNRDQLVTQVQSKYSLDATQAGREVDSLLKGRSF